MGSGSNFTDSSGQIYENNEETIVPVAEFLIMFRAETLMIHAVGSLINNGAIFFMMIETVTVVFLLMKETDIVVCLMVFWIMCLMVFIVAFLLMFETTTLMILEVVFLKIFRDAMMVRMTAFLKMIGTNIVEQLMMTVFTLFGIAIASLEMNIVTSLWSFGATFVVIFWTTLFVLTVAEFLISWAALLMLYTAAFTMFWAAFWVVHTAALLMWFWTALFVLSIDILPTSRAAILMITVKFMKIWIVFTAILQMKSWAVLFMIHLMVFGAVLETMEATLGIICVLYDCCILFDGRSYFYHIALNHLGCTLLDNKGLDNIPLGTPS